MMGKTSSELYQERMKRVEDAICLAKPDRVPFLTEFDFFPARYAGVSCREVMYDYGQLNSTFKKAIVEFQPDMFNNPYGIIAFGPLLDLLDYQQLKWPGHGVPEDSAYQFVEKEYMTADEYDAYNYDPTDYMLRTYLPRICRTLEPLRELPQIPALYYFRVLSGTSVLAKSELSAAIELLQKAGLEAHRMRESSVKFIEEMRELGFPSQYGTVAYAPFDYFGDFFRGTRGIMLDLYRCPEKLLQSMEKALPMIAKSAIDGAAASGNPRVFIPLHKGSHSFMSLDQFRTFYWPGLKQLMMLLIEAGLTPCPKFEGDYTSRLEIISDIPVGKAMYWFEQTDIFQAKEVLRNRVCIRGNVPASLLCTGSITEIKSYCKKLIDIVGKDGGFIMDGSMGIPDEARAENVKALTDFTREYGVYA